MKSWGTGLFVTLVGGILSLLILVATLGATFPTKEDVSDMIAVESPYVKDQSLILYRLGRIETKLDKLLEASE